MSGWRQFRPDSYDPAVVRTLIETGRQRGLSDDHVLTALATGLVESGLRNLGHGHGTSVGWRQEVAKYYGSRENRMNVQAATNRFYDELAATPRAQTLGRWAQAVQRSAHPGRYDEALDVARQVLRHFGGGGMQPGHHEHDGHDHGDEATAGPADMGGLWRQILSAMSAKVAAGATGGVPLAMGMSFTKQGDEIADDGGLRSGLAELFDRYGAPIRQQTEEPGQAVTSDPMQQDAGTRARRGAMAWGGHQNGRIPTSALTRVADGHYLENAAARAWQQMVRDAAAQGVTLRLTDSYRSYDSQVRLRNAKGHKVATATPGTSIHGWGKAIDVPGDAARKWLQQNGARYGWVWPEWARRAGKSYEPWHFEFVGG